MSAPENIDERRSAILEELERILESPNFRGTSRGRQFLDYVVRYQLASHAEQLKERIIGTAVFQRPTGYATGEDPVVRVQAGEVRRRLEQYYQSVADEPLVRIDLPLGSYAPAFHWNGDGDALHARSLHTHEMLEEPVDRRAGWKALGLAAAILLVISSIAALFFLNQRTEGQKSLSEQFWAPVFSTQQPVLVCLVKPVVYRPKQELYRRFESTHPGAFETEAGRTSNPLDLTETRALSGDDFYIADDFGVALGDAYAAINISSVLGRIGKPGQVRIGASYSFQDLRNEPAVLVGAFNNKWTMQLASNLHFTFVENREDFSLREVSPGGRIWRVKADGHGQTTTDYAAVVRLLDSKTGQFTMIVAGIGSTGTQAAGEFIANPRSLEDALRNAPPGWQAKNLEWVLETPITDSVPGPAHVVASYYW